MTRDPTSDTPSSYTYTLITLGQRIDEIDDGHHTKIAEIEDRLEVHGSTIDGQAKNLRTCLGQLEKLEVIMVRSLSIQSLLSLSSAKGRYGSHG